MQIEKTSFFGLAFFGHMKFFRYGKYFSKILCKSLNARQKTRSGIFEAFLSLSGQKNWIEFSNSFSLYTIENMKRKMWMAFGGVLP